MFHWVINRQLKCTATCRLENLSKTFVHNHHVALRRERKLHLCYHPQVKDICPFLNMHPVMRVP